MIVSKYIDWAGMWSKEVDIKEDIDTLNDWGDRGDDDDTNLLLKLRNFQEEKNLKLYPEDCELRVNNIQFVWEDKDICYIMIFNDEFGCISVENPL